MTDEEAIAAIANMTQEEAETFLGRSGYGHTSIKIFLAQKEAKKETKPAPKKETPAVKEAPKVEPKKETPVKLSNPVKK